MEQSERKILFSAFAVALAVMLAAVVSVIWSSQQSGTAAPVRSMVGIVVVTSVVMLIVIFAVIKMKQGSNSRGVKKNSAHAWAQSVGFDYVAKGDSAFGRTVKSLPGISSGGTNKHKMTGMLAGREFLAFENTYIIHTGQAVIPVAHTVFTLSAPASWSSIKISKRNWISRMAYKLGSHRGIEFESQEFNALFKVKAENENFAIAFLSPDLQSFILEKVNATWKIEPNRIALIYAGSMKTSRMNASLSRLERFWSLIADELKSF